MKCFILTLYATVDNNSRYSTLVQAWLASETLHSISITLCKHFCVCVNCQMIIWNVNKSVSVSFYLNSVTANLDTIFFCSNDFQCRGDYTKREFSCYSHLKKYHKHIISKQDLLFFCWMQQQCASFAKNFARQWLQNFYFY